MKQLFVVFMATLAAVSAISNEEIVTIFKKHAKVCIEKRYPGKDWEEVLYTKKFGGCTQACILTRTGLMNKANKLVPGKLDTYILDRDGKSLNEIRQAIDEACKAVTGSNKCNSASKIVSCLITEAKKRGVVD